MSDFVPTDEQIDVAERALHAALSVGQRGGYRRVLAEVLVAVGPMVRRDALAEASTQIVPEDMARLFHETYERLAPDFGYETRAESAVPWMDVPMANRRLMVAVCREVIRAVLARLGGVEKEGRTGGITYDGRDAERYQGQIVARKEPQMAEDSVCSHPASAIRWNPEQQVIQCQACGEAMLVTPSGDVYPTLGGVEKETP